MVHSLHGPARTPLNQVFQEFPETPGASSGILWRIPSNAHPTHLKLTPPVELQALKRRKGNCVLAAKYPPSHHSNWRAPGRSRFPLQGTPRSGAMVVGGRVIIHKWLDVFWVNAGNPGTDGVPLAPSNIGRCCSKHMKGSVWLSPIELGCCLRQGAGLGFS